MITDRAIHHMFAQHMEDLFGEMPTDVLCHLDREDDIKSFLAVWVFHSHDTLSEEDARARQYYIEDPDLSPLDPGWPNLAVSRNIMFELYQKEGCFRWKAGMVDFYIDDPVVVRENIQELSKWLRMGEGDLIPYRGSVCIPSAKRWLGRLGVFQVRRRSVRTSC